MTCAEAEPLLPLVADGVLDPDGDPALFTHLSRCQTCQESLARHDLVTLALERAPRRAGRTIRFPWPVAAAAAAAVLALGLGTWWSLPATPVAAPGPVVHKLPAADGQPDLYLIETEQGPLVVDPTQVDGGSDGSGARAVPVNWRR
ncbi:MAG: hypothetical protein RLZZ127_27 [Planctomycetota bacterium]|jgi:hypothetical protein